MPICGQSGRYVEDGATPYYSCSQVHTQLAGTTCQSLRGDGIDAEVARTFLKAMQPAQLEIAMAALDQVEDQAQQIDRQWQRRIEQAHYEADLAQRRFGAVDPENRLVARSLERDWNEKRVEVQRLERDHATRSHPTLYPTHPAQRQRILDLARDLPTVWHADTTPPADRKQRLPFLIKDVTLTRQATTIHLGIRWQTDALTDLDIPRPQRVWETTRTPPAVVDRVRQLAPTHTDRQIAEALQQTAWTPGKGGVFTASKVQRIRYAYGIPTGCPQAPGACPTGQRGDGRYTARAAAQLLQVDVSTIADWCTSGQLDGLQERPHGPRWIRLTPERIATLRKPKRQRGLPACPDEPAEV